MKANQFTLRIDTDNADFKGQDPDALKAIFDQICERINYDGALSGTVRDRNGNLVGEYVWYVERP